MAGDPHPIFQDGIPVAKANARAFLPLRLGNPAALRALDGSTFWLCYIQTTLSFFYRDPSDTISSDNGTSVIVDADGNIWKIISSGAGIAVNAAGPLGDRGDFNGENPGFTYFGTDTELLYIRLTGGGWSSGSTIIGPQGEPGEQGEPGDEGPSGPANTLSIGTVTGGASANATISGSAPNQTLNLVLPNGADGADGTDGSDGLDGNDGWSPVFSIETDSARRVLRVVDWVGGEGSKPATGKYVGASGLETNIGDGVDIRGPQGSAGTGSGDMEKSVYDPDDNGKFDNAALSDMAQGTVKMRRAGAGTGAPTDTSLPNLKTDLALNNVTNDAQIPLSYLDTDGTLAANSDTKVASQKAVKTAINALLGANDAEVYKGTIDCSANPNYPAADAGHVYRVSVAGKIGGASGVNVEVNDRLQCTVDSTSSGNQATVGANWWITQANIDGAMVGPASAVDGTPMVADGATGKLLKNITFAAFKTLLSLVKGDVGLGNVDNTSDANKPVSSATATRFQDMSIEFVIDGGGSAITTGLKGYLEMPFAGTIARWTILGDQSGSIVIDIFKCDYATFDPTTHPAAADKITASAPPTVSSAKKAQSSALTGWTTTFAAGDILAFNVNSITTMQRVTISLKGTR